MGVAFVQTKWGTVVTQVEDPATDNPDCDIAIHGCSMMAYLAMTGHNKTFAAIHNHGADGLFVVNLFVDDPNTDKRHLITGPYPTLLEAVHDATNVYMVQQTHEQEEVRKAKGVQPTTASVISGRKQSAKSDKGSLDARRRMDSKDWESTNSSETPWEEQLKAILNPKK